MRDATTTWAPAAAGQMLIALDFWLAEVPEIVLVGDPAAEEMVEVLQRLHQAYFPNRVIACRSSDETITSPVLAAVFEGKLPVAESLASESEGLEDQKIPCGASCARLSRP